MIALTGACIEADDISSMESAVRAQAISDGEITRLFEARYANCLNVAGAVATNSATSALILALATLDVGSGDEVVLPSYTCVAILNALRQVGATPRLVDNSYDVARMDYNLTVETVRQALSPRTRAVIVPHMFGVPARMDEILGLGIPVIEDITLSLGAACAGRPVGSWGDLSVCSFHASKMIACGEGGMLACKTAALYDKAYRLNNWVSEQAAVRRVDDYHEPYQLRYNYRLVDVAAALGLSQLAKLPRFVARRRLLATRYAERLSPIPKLRVPLVTQEANVFHRYLVAAEGISVVDAIREFAAAGIEVGRGVYPPLHRYLGLPKADYPGAEHAVASLLSIPIYPALTDEQAAFILDVSEVILTRLFT